MTVTYKPQAITQLIYEMEKLGIETSLQHTYFGYEVCVHIYGNTERASIMSVEQFMNWAPNYIADYGNKPESEDLDDWMDYTNDEVI
tara:strand:+ start:275 stop:535 length:261 start_codon:yes stop_codon:yes gene_type:complete